MSVLCTDEEHSKNAEHGDIDLCGKISILYGFQDTIVSVVASEVVGMYDYISGAVYGLQGCCHDDTEYQLKVIYCKIFYWYKEVKLPSGSVQR